MSRKRTFSSRFYSKTYSTSQLLPVRPDVLASRHSFPYPFGFVQEMANVIYLFDLFWCIESIKEYKEGPYIVTYEQHQLVERLLYEESLEAMNHYRHF